MGLYGHPRPFAQLRQYRHCVRRSSICTSMLTSDIVCVWRETIHPQTNRRMVTPTTDRFLAFLCNPALMAQMSNPTTASVRYREKTHSHAASVEMSVPYVPLICRESRYATPSCPHHTQEVLLCQSALTPSFDATGASVPQSLPLVLAVVNT